MLGRIGGAGLRAVARSPAAVASSGSRLARAGIRLTSGGPATHELAIPADARVLSALTRASALVERLLARAPKGFGSNSSETAKPAPAPASSASSAPPAGADGGSSGSSSSGNEKPAGSSDGKAAEGDVGKKGDDTAAAGGSGKGSGGAGGSGGPSLEDLFEHLRKGTRVGSSSGGGKGGSGDKGGGKPGSGGSGKGPGDDGGNSSNNNENLLALLTASIALYAAYTLFAGAGMERGREISWQEFRTTYLATGMVDRLEVVNKTTVRVYARPHPAPAFLDAAARSGSGGGGGARSAGAASASASGDPYASGGAGTGGAGIDVDAYGPLPPHIEGELRKAMAEQRAAAGRGGLGHAAPVAHFRIGSVDSFERQLEDAQLDLGLRPRDFVLVRHVAEGGEGGGGGLLGGLGSIMMTVGLYMLVMRFMSGGGSGSGGFGGLGGGGAGSAINRAFGFGRAKPTVINKDAKVKVTFKDVAGCDEAKGEIMEFVSFLKDPSKFTVLGAKIPKGALLVGPPGTGKTLLAKATAGEAGVPFFSMSGSDFIEMFVGVGPSRVRDLFAQARQAAPCIIFIDEIDAVARSRSKGGFSGGNDERENTLNQLLVEMDGFATTEGIVVLAGTNRADILDKAILRPGRFDRQIMVDKPDIAGRKDIFLVHMKPIKIAGDAEAYAQRLAALTPGFVGADIHNICNEAAIVAARQGKAAVDMKDFEAAIDRVIGGLERRNALMTAEERKTVAYHEAGHAIAGWFLEHADPLLKVTIIPRGNGALGFAQYLPKEVTLFTREALMDRMAMALGGRAAEELSFGRITTGAADDLDKVTQIAYAMTSVYGMNTRLGRVSFPNKDNGQSFTRPYSEATAQMIDEEARTIIDDAYRRVKDLLTVHAEQLKGVAELLLAKETISQADIISIAGPRPYPINEKIAQYITYTATDAAGGAGADKKEGDAGAAAAGGDDAAKGKPGGGGDSGSGGGGSASSSPSSASSATAASSGAAAGSSSDSMLMTVAERRRQRAAAWDSVLAGAAVPEAPAVSAAAASTTFSAAVDAAFARRRAAVAASPGDAAATAGAAASAESVAGLASGAAALARGSGAAAADFRRLLDVAGISRDAADAPKLA